MSIMEWIEVLGMATSGALDNEKVCIILTAFIQPYQLKNTATIKCCSSNRQFITNYTQGIL